MTCKHNEISTPINYVSIDNMNEYLDCMQRDGMKSIPSSRSNHVLKWIPKHKRGHPKFEKHAPLDCLPLGFPKLLSSIREKLVDDFSQVGEGYLRSIKSNDNEESTKTSFLMNCGHLF